MSVCGVCVCVCEYVCMCVCVYVCICVCVYVCMSVCVCLCVCVWRVESGSRGYQAGCLLSKDGIYKVQKIIRA